MPTSPEYDDDPMPLAAVNLPAMYRIPTPDQLGHMMRNQRPRTPAVEGLLEEITERMLRLALWCEGRVPHGPELAEVLRPGGPIDQTRGLLKAAVARRHPDQAAGSILPGTKTTVTTNVPGGARALVDDLIGELCHDIDLDVNNFERTSFPERLVARDRAGFSVAVWTDTDDPPKELDLHGKIFRLDTSYEALPGRFPNRYVLPSQLRPKGQ